MKTLKVKLGITVLFISIAVFFSCKKSDINNMDSVISVSEETSISDEMMDDALDQVDVYQDSELKNEDLGPCRPTITITFPDGTKFPKLITIDYGTDGCEGMNGIIRKGKIIVTLTGPMDEVGSKRIITFDNYSVNDFKVEGRKEVTYRGIDEMLYPYWSIEVDGKVTSPGGREFTHAATKTRKWIEGFDTPQNKWDDVYSITGSSHGINFKGKAYSSITTAPLIKARNCRWIQEGVKIITSEEDEIIIDFGDGTCDNKAILYLNGVGHEIILDKKF